MDIGKPGTGHEREDLPADKGIAAGPALELDKAVNCTACIRVLGMEKCGTMIAFNDS